MVQKAMVFLFMLIGWSQTFPYHNVPTEDRVMKDADKIERERRDVMQSVSATCVCVLLISYSILCSFTASSLTHKVTVTFN